MTDFIVMGYDPDDQTLWDPPTVCDSLPDALRIAKQELIDEDISLGGHAYVYQLVAKVTPAYMTTTVAELKPIPVATQKKNTIVEI